MRRMAVKQTGPRYRVKSTMKNVAAILGLCLVAAAVSSCVDARWYNERRDKAENRADERECNARAEDMALTRAGKQRATYEAPRPTVNPGMYRGKTPMELADQGETISAFARQMKACMESKGYPRGKPAAPMPN